MSANKDSAPDSNGPKGSWRGKGTSGASDTPGPAKGKQYRWQKDWTKKQDEERVQGNRWHRFKIGFFSLAGIALTAYFFYIIFYRAPKTPFITAVVTDYGWALPPNAWATEDVAAYKGLNGQTLDWKDDTSHWTSAELGLKHLAQSLEEFRKTNRPSLVIYLSAHGLVNGAGEPCLMTPSTDSNPLDESTWLPLSKVLDVIKSAELPDELNKVLILDSNRIDTNWGAGVLQNGFAKSLESSLRGRASKDQIRRLTILNSTSPGQIGWASPELRKSVFGHYVYLGLRGEADADQNYRVSLSELQNYLDLQVSQWVSENRADQQRPILISSEEDFQDFELTYKPAKTWGFGWLHSTDPLPEEASDSEALTVASNDLNEIWKEHDTNLAQNPRRFAPLKWREVEHQLLQLERMARAGSAYEALTDSGAFELKKRVGDMMFDRLARSLPTHSVALAEHFGRVDKESASSYARKVRKGVESFLKSPNRETLDRAAAGLISVDDVFAPGGAVEGQQLRMLSRFLDDEVLVKNGELIAEIVATRNLAERLAGDSGIPDSRNRPSDERVQYWIRTTIEAGDRALRQAEDNIFVGDSDSMAAAKTALEKAKASYTRAAALANSVAIALNLRDQVSAELPYLAQWLTRRVVAGQAAQESEADQRIKYHLQALIDESHNFGNYLEESLPADLLEAEPTSDEMEEACLALQKRTADLSHQFEIVQNDFQRACEDLVTKAGQDQRTLRALDAALSIPLVKAKDRVKMRATYAELSQRLHQQFLDGAGTTVTNNASPPSQVDPYAERMRGWGRHPALGLIEPIAPIEKQPATRTINIEREQSRMREVLRGLEGELRSVPRKLEDLGSSNNELDIRRIYNRADRLARASAAFTTYTPAHEPADQLRRVDLRHMLTWHARRALEDFWGPPADRKPSFFADVSRSYLVAAKTMWQTESGLKKQFEPEMKLLETRLTAAKWGVHPDTLAMVLTGEETEISHGTVPRVDPGVPVGRAAVYLMDAEKKLPLAVNFGESGRVRRMGITVPASGASTPLRYSMAATEVSSEFYQAFGLFRGHLYSHPFSVTHGGGVMIVREAPIPTLPRVTLKGQRNVQGSVVLILDCSGSMREKTENEQGKSATRMEVAKSAFERLVTGLGKAGDFEVGVYFYGHRAGWLNGKIENPKNYVNRIPDNLQPYEDVEPIVPLGRFEPHHRDRVLAALQSVGPWGETPLYLSILTALQSFPPGGGEGQSIIVLTDGHNQVQNAPEDKIVGKTTLLEALKVRPVPVHIVSFELSKSDLSKKGLKETVDEFTEISKKSRGSFTQASTAAELTNRLKEELRPRMFQVFGGDKTFEGRVQGTVEVTPPPRERTTYSVEYKTRVDEYKTSLDLEGGEGIELSFNPAGSTLIHRRYNARTPVFSPVIRAANGGYVVGLHRPDFKPPSAQGERVPHFLISLQNADETLFSPRPVEAWVEIVPKYPGGAPPDDANLPEKFIFTDLNYEKYTPVPVLALPVPQWPKQANRAEVTVFWKLKRSTTPDTEVTVEAALAMPEEARHIGRAPKNRFQVSTRGGEAQGTQRVAVLLKGPDMDTIKVTMTPEPKTAYHRVDVKNGIAVHNFDFTGEQDVLKHKLQFTTKQSLKTDALGIQEPLSVEVVDLGDVFK